jgi:cyclic pyranopterin phosphate synthase
LKCNYCDPPTVDGGNVGIHVVPENRQIERLLNIFVKKCGIEKIRLTGGEPTIDSNFTEYMLLLTLLPLRDVGITTNGVLMSRYLDQILSTFNLINISLDTLDREKFQLISNRSGMYHDRVMDGIRQIACSKREAKLKLNTVVMKGVNDDEF